VAGVGVAMRLVRADVDFAEPASLRLRAYPFAVC